MDAKVSSHDSDGERLLVAWMVSPEWSAVQHGLSLTLRELFLSWDPDSVVSRESPLGLQTAAFQDLNTNRSSRFLGCLPQRGDQGADGRSHLPGEAGTVGPGVHLLCVFPERRDAEQHGFRVGSHHQALSRAPDPGPPAAPAACPCGAPRAFGACGPKAGPPADGHHPGGPQHGFARRRGWLREGPLPK